MEFEPTVFLIMTKMLPQEFRNTVASMQHMVITTTLTNVTHAQSM